MENRLVITGVVDGDPETRYSPAGIPITRFRLKHQSVQRDGGLQRHAECLIGVVVSGEPLQQSLHDVAKGMVVRVTGYLSRGSYRGEYGLALHAQRIEPAPTAN